MPTFSSWFGWYCDICGDSYFTKKEAIQCEKSHYPLTYSHKAEEDKEDK